MNQAQSNSMTRCDLRVKVAELWSCFPCSNCHMRRRNFKLLCCQRLVHTQLNLLTFSESSRSEASRLLSRSSRFCSASEMSAAFLSKLSNSCSLLFSNSSIYKNKSTNIMQYMCIGQGGNQFLSAIYYRLSNQRVGVTCKKIIQASIGLLQTSRCKSDMVKT